LTVITAATHDRTRTVIYGRGCVRKAITAAAAIMAAAAALTTAPTTASATPGPARLSASYTSNGTLGYWNAHFRGRAKVTDDGMFHVSGYLEASCPGGVVNGFGRFGFRNQATDSAWKTFDVTCGSGGSTSLSIDADGVGEPGDDLGITVCMGGLLVYTECGGEETVTLTE
jgi:hypothetical protein